MCVFYNFELVRVSVLCVFCFYKVCVFGGKMGILRSRLGIFGELNCMVYFGKMVFWGTMGAFL